MPFGLFKKKDDKKKKKPAKQVAPSVPAADVPEENGTSKAAPVVPVSGTSVLRHMHVSEKSSMGQAVGQYTFIVSPNASKSEIAKEVETRYGVSVRAVKVNKRKGKSRRIGRYQGVTGGIKKAVVVLAHGQTIASA